MSNKELTATQFNKDPAQFYRAAYDGETVTISHDHYGQGLFELTYRKRGFKPEPAQVYVGDYFTSGRTGDNFAIASVSQTANGISAEMVLICGFKPDKEQLTDEQKNALILEMTRGSNDHLKFHFPEDLPGYAIIWQKEPHPVTGLIQFRWTNYAMRNGLADSFEDCLHKAREHAKCQSK